MTACIGGQQRVRATGAQRMLALRRREELRQRHVHDAGLQCLPRLQVLALGHELQCRFDADQPRQPLRCTAARQQTDLDFGQTVQAVLDIIAASRNETVGKGAHDGR